jgi:hypothetical protein
VKEESLSKLILFGEGSLRRAMREYAVHYHAERNHQGSPTSCCFLRLRKRDVAGRSNVVRGWAVYCATTTEPPRKLASKS